MNDLMRRLKSCDRNEYGKVLTEAIEHLGLSKKDAAELCGTAYTSMVSWCSGNKYPARLRNHIYAVLESLSGSESDETVEEVIPFTLAVGLARMGYSERETVFTEGDLEKVILKFDGKALKSSYESWVQKNYLPGDIVILPDKAKGFIVANGTNDSIVFVPELGKTVQVEKKTLLKTGEKVKV